jgi:glycosyltransferase involved in cell wall biosynthesis
VGRGGRAAVTRVAHHATSGAAPPTIVILAPFQGPLTGGPLYILTMIEALAHNVRPVVVVPNQSPLHEALVARGVDVRVANLGPMGGRTGWRRRLLSVAANGLAVVTIFRSNLAVRRIVRDERAALFWARGAKSMLLGAIGARLGGARAIWDIALEADSRGRVRLVHKLAGNLANRIVAQAAELLTTSVGRSGRLRLRSSVVTPCVSDARAQQLRAADASRTRGLGEPLRVLMVGSFTPRKNQLLLVDALEMQDGADVVATIAGPRTDAAYAQAVEMRVQQSNAAARITLSAYVEDVPALMGRADVLVLCSTDEGVPMIGREALFAGLPIVSTRVGGTAAVVEDGRNGFLVEPTPASLADRLTRLAGDPELVRAMASASRERAERFSMARWRAEYLNILRGAMRDA